MIDLVRYLLKSKFVVLKSNDVTFPSLTLMIFPLNNLKILSLGLLISFPVLANINLVFSLSESLMKIFS